MRWQIGHNGDGEHFTLLYRPNTRTVVECVEAGVRSQGSNDHLVNWGAVKAEPQSAALVGGTGFPARFHRSILLCSLRYAVADGVALSPQIFRQFRRHMHRFFIRHRVYVQQV